MEPGLSGSEEHLDQEDGEKQKKKRNMYVPYSFNII